MNLTRVVESLKKQAFKTGRVALSEKYSLETGENLIGEITRNHETGIIASHLYVTTVGSEPLEASDGFIESTLRDVLFFKEKACEETAAIQELKRRAYRWGWTPVRTKDLCTGEYIISMYKGRYTGDVIPCCLYLTSIDPSGGSVEWEVSNDEYLGDLICE